MDPLISEIASQLALRNAPPHLDMGGAVAKNLSAGPAPTDPMMMPVPDVNLGDPNAALKYQPGAGKGAHGAKNSKLDAILGMLGAGGEIGAALMGGEPEAKTPYSPIETAGLGSAQILGGTDNLSPLEKSATQVSPYQSAIASLLGR